MAVRGDKTLERLVKAEQDAQDKLAESRARLGAHLRVLRDAHGLTVREVGDAVGINFSQVARIEAGESWKPATVMQLVGYYRGLKAPRARKAVVKPALTALEELFAV